MAEGRLRPSFGEVPLRKKIMTAAAFAQAALLPIEFAGGALLAGCSSDSTPGTVATAPVTPGSSPATGSAEVPTAGPIASSPIGGPDGPFSSQTPVTSETPSPSLSPEASGSTTFNLTVSEALGPDPLHAGKTIDVYTFSGECPSTPTASEGKLGPFSWDSGGRTDYGIVDAINSKKSDNGIKPEVVVDPIGYADGEGGVYIPGNPRETSGVTVTYAG